MPFSRPATKAPSDPPVGASVPPELRGLVWTAASLVAVTAVKLWQFDILGPATPFLLYFISIITAAWFGGWAGGLVSTGISALLGSYFFLPPYGTLSFADLPTTVRLGVFVAEGVAITAITTRMRQERIRAAVAAREAKSTLAKLEGVLRAVTDGITVQDERGELLYANQAAATLTGFETADALLAAPISDVMARFELRAADGGPFDPAELPGRLALQGVPAPERLVRFRVRSTTEERFALIRANTVRLDDTGALAAVNVFQDVTETQRQERALLASHERFATTLRSIGDAVIATDALGRVTFMNPLAEQLTGFSLSSAEGKLLPEVFQIVDEETRAPADNPVERVLREGTAVGLANHTLLIARDGTEVCIDDSAAPIRASEGELLGTVLVFRDVTERRADELRGNFIARATTELARSLDYRETLSTVARLAVPSVADWCAVDMVEGGKVTRLAVEHVDPEKVRLVYEIQRRYPTDPDGDGAGSAVVRTGKPLFMREIPEELLVAAAKDDEHLRLLRELQLQSVVSVPLMHDGSVIGVISLAMAESGRRHGPRDLELALALADRAVLAVTKARLYAAATEARAEAERANLAKDEFLAMLGHELRNPLAPILTALELMRMRAPDAFERERAIVERQVKHLVTLVDDLLDVSRITRGSIELSMEAVDMARLVATALELAAPLIEERRHTVTVDVPEGLLVAADSARLARVVANLLTNAAKYTEPGGRIDVVGALRDGEVSLTVTDNGVGIDAELLPRVFEPFVQGRQALDRAQGGLGLGLAIARNVVELHQGRLSAASDGPGKGTELCLVLPVASSSSPKVAVERGTAARLSVRAHDAIGPRVLVVDDNEDAREALAEALQFSGYETHSAADAAAALSSARANAPQVALLDIGLPAMDGYQLAQRLRELPELKQTRLVAITGYGQIADKEKAMAAGFDDHLVKPVALEEVIQVIERLVRAR